MRWFLSVFLLTPIANKAPSPFPPQLQIFNKPHHSALFPYTAKPTVLRGPKEIFIDTIIFLKLFICQILCFNGSIFGRFLIETTVKRSPLLIYNWK